MRLKLSALLVIAVAAVGLDENVFYTLFFYAISAMMAFFAEIKSPKVRTNARKPSRYEQIELTTGRGWGSKREELRAHLLGVWEPRSHTPPPDLDKSLGWATRACYVGLFFAAIGAFWGWPLVVIGFSLTVFAQFFSTERFGLLSAMFAHAMFSVLAFAYFFSPHMLALSPAILIFARKDGDA